MIIVWRRLAHLIRGRIGLILVVGIGRAVMNHVALRRRNLDGSLCIGILDSVQHAIEVVRFDNDLARSDLAHRFLRRVLPFDLLSLGLLGLRPVSLEDAITEPFLLGTVQGG
jgi:hypothetical protein